MLRFFLSAENAPFLIALGTMFTLGILEIATTLLGFSASSLVDALLPDLDADLDLDVDADVDAEAPGGGSHGGLLSLFAWVNAGRVPLLILLTLFLFGFGMCGLVIQTAAAGALGSPIPWWAAAIPALVAALFVTRTGSLAIGKILPKDETEAVSENTFVGRAAVITVGTALKGRPAEARLTDAFGQTHYVLVEPDEEDARFPAGTSVLLVGRRGARFLAIENPGA